MKNIYDDTPQNGSNVNSGAFEFPDDTKQPPKAPVIKQHTPKPPQPKKEEAKESQQPPQPQQYAQPYGYVQMPYYYAPPVAYQQPPYQPGYVQPVQMTPEQYAAFIQQYPPQQYAQPYGYPPQYAPPQYAPPQPQQEQSSDDAIDSGRRVLYQSVDFDKPLNEPEGNYEDYSPSEEKEAEINEPLKTELEETTLPDSSFEDIPFIIEEETVSMPEIKPEAPKSSMKVEEMEMSTFELNAILGRQQFTQAKPALKSDSKPKPKADVPLNFGSSFQIEETVNEVVSDISSDSKPKPTAKAEKKKKKLPVSELIRRIVLGVSLGAIVIAAGMLLNEYRLSKENDNLEEGISDLIISVPEETTTKKSDKNKETTKPQESTTAPLTPEQQWAQIQAEYPNLIFPVGIQLKYAKLYATNQDFVGYLEAEGINMSLPIVQSKNDSDYLEKNFYKKKTKYGCPFVTHLNNITELDQNTVIFGHHMNNGTVFGALDEYKTIDGFKAAPLITFNTLYKDYSWKVIAAFVTNAYEEDDNGYVFRYYFTQLSTQDRFAAYLNELSQRSLYDTGVDVLPTDKLLTLSTCSHEFEDARFVVVARLVRNGESTDVDVSKATVNPSPRYPQAFYKKKKLDNPYKDAYRWEVG